MSIANACKFYSGARSLSVPTWKLLQLLVTRSSAEQLKLLGCCKPYPARWREQLAKDIVGAIEQLEETAQPAAGRGAREE
jgi:hypothetical protein